MRLSSLQQLTQNALSEIITADYILLDVPHYSNVGDVMLWEATLQLLKKVPHRCLYSCSIETYYKPRINNNTILLFTGGGNFGDLWERHQTFRHKIMNDFPENPIVQLPQSVWFDNIDKMQVDIVRWKQHKGRTTICLRDKQSYDIIRQNYNINEVKLLPDLALSLNIELVVRRNRLHFQAGKGTLFLKRADKESADTTFNFSYDAVGDWPSMTCETRLYRKYQELLRRCDKFHLSEKRKAQFSNLYYRYILKDAYLRSGIRFLLPYGTLYTNRLHAAILGLLLGKEVRLIDNSYHKNEGVYQQWLEDQLNITLV